MNKSYKAVKWNGISSLLNQIVTILLGIILMRLLPPKDFGLLGMVTVFTGFLNVLKDGGLGASLIYKKRLHKLDLSTVFWFNLFMGIFLFSLVYGMSGPMANYYEEDRLVLIVKVYALLFIIMSTTVVHQSLLIKHLEFKKKFISEILALVLSGIVGLVLAIYDFGVWSLIYMHIFRSTVHAMVLWYYLPFKPKFIFSLKVLKNHFGYSLPVFGTKSFNYWTRNADNLLVGKYLGSEALGFYSRAYFFVSFPVQRFTSTISTVLFPVMSQSNYQLEKIGSLFIRSIKSVALVTFPLMGLLFVAAEPFVLIIFGENWSPIILTLKIFCVLGMVESIIVLTTPVMYAIGATKINFILSISFGIVNIIVFYFGSQFSIETVAWLLLASTTIFSIIRIYFIENLTELKFIAIVSALGSTFIITLISIFLVLIISNFISELDIWFKGILLSSCFLLVYSSFALFFLKGIYIDLLKSFKKLI